jgi:REP element-mobilizing transposase RayT
MRARKPHAGAEIASGAEIAPLRVTLGRMVAYFKYQSTKHINEMRGMPGGKLWQRNYYEHIIRNDDELNRIRAYIANNPAHWDMDRENPNA